jgi:L-malate glycosyltransferase
VRRCGHGFRGYSKAVSVIGHGIDLENYPPMSKAAARASTGLRDCLTIGYVGIITERKGVFVLADAFRRAKLANAQLVYIGSGDADDALHAAIAGDDALRNAVSFVPAVGHAEIPRFLASLDILVLPSLTTPRWKEQFGRIIIEAMASRVAVIGSDSGGIPFVIGTGGLVVPEGDSESLSAALRELALDPTKRERLSECGFERVCRSFTWSAVANQVADLYRQCGLVSIANAN